MKEFESLLELYEPISFEKMGEVKLMNRSDTKFIFHFQKLESILKKAVKDYFVFKIDSNFSRTYETRYFDTDSLSMYINHHNQRLNRYKVRERLYADTKEKFLEIKFKNNKGATIKRRIKIDESQQMKSKESFISEKSPYELNELTESVNNKFTRIMLVSKLLNERVTIDYNLEFITKEGISSIPDLVIVEQKKSASEKRTSFSKILLEERVQATGFSKYCMGVVLTKAGVKANRFKRKLLRMKKMNIIPQEIPV